MTDVQLEDFLGVYPVGNTPNLQTIISSKQEFRELASFPSEPTPGPGQFYNIQSLIQRYIIPYDKLFLFWRTGTGKSKGIVNCSEEFRTMYETDPINAPIKRVYILSRGKTLLNEFRNQIACGSDLLGTLMKRLQVQQLKRDVRIT